MLFAFMECSIVLRNVSINTHHPKFNILVVIRHLKKQDVDPEVGNNYGLSSRQELVVQRIAKCKNWRKIDIGQISYEELFSTNLVILVI